MKQVLYIFLIATALTACTRGASTLQDAPNHHYSDGEFTMVKWAGHRWAVIPEDEFSKPFRYELMLLDAEERDFEKVEEAISREYGEPMFTNATLPKDLIRNFMNCETLFLPDCRDIDERETVIYWEKDDTFIRLYLSPSDAQVDLPATAIIAVINMDVLTRVCVELENEE